MKSKRHLRNFSDSPSLVTEKLVSFSGGENLRGLKCDGKKITNCKNLNKPLIKLKEPASPTFNCIQNREGLKFDESFNTTLEGKT